MPASITQGNIGWTWNNYAVNNQLIPGFIKYTYNAAQTSVDIWYSVVNWDDTAAITVNGGGILTVTTLNPCVILVGNEIHGWPGPGTYGDIHLNVSSTLPFTEANLELLSMPAGTFIPSGIVSMGCLQTITNTIIICAGDGIITNGNYETTAGVYGDTTLTVLDPIITSTIDTLCINSPSVTLNSNSTGGTWSGSIGVNGSTGEFTPVQSNVGTQNIIYTVTAANGLLVCDDTLSIEILPIDDASFTYATTTFCVNGINPLPTSVSTPGGTFSMPNGTINSGTGEIDLTNTPSGNYWVHYSTNSTGNLCPSNDSLQVTIIDDNPTFNYPQASYCSGDLDPSANITGSTGGIFTINNSGAIDPSTGLIDLDASGPNNYTVTYTSGLPCQNFNTFSLEILPMDTAAFSFNASEYCTTDSNPTPAITGTTGGTFSINNGGSINTSTGEIDLTATPAGNYSITYLVSGRKLANFQNNHQKTVQFHRLKKIDSVSNNQGLIVYLI